MASKNQTSEPVSAVKQPDQQTPQLFEIGELRQKHKIGRAVFAGVCSAKEWKSGKAVAEDDFLMAVAQFTGGPMSGALPIMKESEAKE